MQYQCEVTIAAPRARVIELMSDPSRTGEWLQGMSQARQLQGDPGRPGSVRELHFEGMPGGAAAPAMTEKVERLDEEHYDLVYLVGPVRNVHRNTFEATSVDGAEATRWVADHTFMMPPGMEQGMGEQGAEAFRANTQASMEHFQRWCEANA